MDPILEYLDSHPGSTLTSCGSLGKLHIGYVPQFTHVQNMINKSIFL